MTPGDRVALEALSLRLDHTAAVARLVATFCTVEPDGAEALLGIAETIAELSDRLDVIVGTPRQQ